MLKDKVTLAEALEELEKIVDVLSRSDIDVEKGLEEFKKGVELVEFCRSQLKTAENQFIELKARLDKTSIDADEDVAQ